MSCNSYQLYLSLNKFHRDKVLKVCIKRLWKDWYLSDHSNGKLDTRFCFHCHTRNRSHI